jgi:hypothetical protein
MDLSLIPMKDLLDEVVRRSETAIIFLHKADGDTDENQYWNWCGDHFMALGFCQEMANKIITGASDD